MGGLRRITLSEAMEALQSDLLQKRVYFRRNDQYNRVIDFEWNLVGSRKGSLINQTFYMELISENNKYEEEK